jgi:hypothetical protein
MNKFPVNSLVWLMAYSLIEILFIFGISIMTETLTKLFYSVSIVFIGIVIMMMLDDISAWFRKSRD